jgi:hypothetical protein
MNSHKLVIAGILACACISLAIACGPDFPWQLLNDRSATLKGTPANGFAYEAMHLAARPKDRLKGIETDPFATDEEKYKQLVAVETDGLSSEQAETIRRMRKADDGDVAFERGTTLPAALRLYTAGAVDFRRSDMAGAAARFEAILRLSDNDRLARSVWASYMLGRIHGLTGDVDQAAASFRQTRALAIDGEPDPLGLAVASYGEEAKLHFARARHYLVDDALPAESAAAYGAEIASAVALYAEQAARGSRGGIDSLRIVAEQNLGAPAKLAAAVADPLVQRLLVAYVLARVDDIGEQVAAPAPGKTELKLTPNPLLVTLVDAIERQGQDRQPGADRLAALAYRLGRYDLARHLADKAPSPLASWVKAKLALQRGDLALAASFYAEASKGFPDASDAPSLDPGNTRLLVGEAGVLALAQGEYVDALDRLYPVAGTYWGDVAHIADRVVTVDELKRFVDAKVPPPSVSDRNNGIVDNDERPWPVADPAAGLRDLLARRLVREGRYHDAVAYFRDPKEAKHVGDYAQALTTAGAGGSNIDRARGWYVAGLLARRSGMEMMGAEARPDFFVYGGGFDGGLGQDRVDGPFITEGERERFAASPAKPDLRYHYRYLAVDQLVHAADLLPPRSQAFAAVLCTATGWMLRTPGAGERADDLYKRYVKEGPLVGWAAHFGRRCPEPDFAAAEHFTRTRYLRLAQRFVSHYRWPLVFGFIVLVGGALAWRVRRRVVPPAA